MTKNKEQIIRHAGIYTLSSQLTQVITLVAAILCRRFLGPLQMGVWATLQIVLDYSKYSTLGTMHTVLRQIPYYEGKGDTRSADALKNVSFTTVLVSSLAVSLGVIVYAGLTKGQHSGEVTAGLFLLAAIILLQRLSDLSVQLMRCFKLVELASLHMILSALVNSALVAFLAYYFKIYGFMWAMILSLVFNILYVHLRYNFRLRLNFDFTRFKAAVAYGFPLMALSILMTFLRTIDKIFIVRMLSFEALGFYSIALMATSYVSQVTNSLAIVYIPHFQAKFGENDSAQDLRNYLIKASSGYAMIIPAGIAAIWLMGPYFISKLLPEFVPGIPAMKVLSLGIFFFALSQAYRDFMIAIKKHMILFPLLGAVTALAAFANYAAIKAGWGITGVAAGTGLALFLDFSANYYWASRETGEGSKSLGRYLYLVGCLLYLGGALLLLDFLFPFEPGFTHMLSKAAAFVPFYLPFLFKLNRDFGLFQLLQNRWRKKKD